MHNYQCVQSSGCFYDSLHTFISFIYYIYFVLRLPVLSFRGLTVGSTLVNVYLATLGRRFIILVNMMAGGLPRVYPRIKTNVDIS